MRPSEQIDLQITKLSDWRSDILRSIRKLILQTDATIIEEWKWDTAAWSSNGLICAVGTFKDHLKINFFKGAALPDPQKTFNAGLEAKGSRAINLYEGDQLDNAAFEQLIRAAIAYNAYHRA